MITLITAPPGYGKTAYTVWTEIRKAVDDGRLVYTSGIPKLKLPTVPLKDGEIRKWHETDEKIDHDDPDEVVKLKNIDEGALVVIDEVQRIWRPSGTTVPDDIAALETHRHHGIDFVVICQHPSLLHRNVRALVGKHIHITSTFSGRKMFEWAEWCENPQTRSQRALATKSNYVLPKGAFDLYESASMHIKVKRKMPLQVAVVAACVVIFPAMLYFLYHRIDARIHPVSEANAGEQVAKGKITTASKSAPSFQSFDQQIQKPEKQSYESVQLVSTQYDWSKIAACTIFRDECRCYGDEAERLVIPDNVCRSAVSNGWSGRKALTPENKKPPTTTQEEKAASV